MSKPDDIAEWAWIPAGDETQAEALRIAERRLLRLGWSHTSADIGKVAREIIDGMGTASAIRNPEGGRG